MEENAIQNNQSNPYVSAAIQSGGNIISNLWNELFMGRHMRLANEYNKEMLDYSHELNVSDWNMQNEYNLPKNQYQRYIDAGLTPAAAAQAVSGVASQGANMNSSQAGSLNAPVNPLNMDGIAGVMIDSRKQAAEARLAESQARLYEVQANSVESKTPEEIKEIQSRVLKNNKEVEVDEELKKKYIQETDRIAQLTPVEREKIVEEKNLILQKIAETQEAIENLKEQRNLYKSEESKNYAQAELYSTQAQGEVYTNYSKYVQALKDDITRWFVQTFHCNPDDEFWKQLIESASQGEEYGMSFIRAIGDFAQGVDSEIVKHFPNFHRTAKVAAGLYGLKKLVDAKDSKIDWTLDKFGDIARIIGSFKGLSVPNPQPIGFRRY